MTTTTKKKRWATQKKSFQLVLSRPAAPTLQDASISPPAAQADEAKSFKMKDLEAEVVEQPVAPLHATDECVTLRTDDEATFITRIAGMLGETREVPIAQLTIFVRAIGRPAIMQLLRETLLIECAGGMMLPDGSRRRTPGGVFFQLARTQYCKPYWRYVRMKKRVWRDEKKQQAALNEGSKV